MEREQERRGAVQNLRVAILALEGPSERCSDTAALGLIAEAMRNIIRGSSDQDWARYVASLLTDGLGYTR